MKDNEYVQIGLKRIANQYLEVKDGTVPFEHFIFFV